MSFFSNLMGNDPSTEKLNEQEAFMGVLLSVIASDGYFSDEEVGDFWTTLSRAKIMCDYTDRKYNDSVNKLMKIVKGPGHEQLLTLSIASLPDSLREGAFVYACDLVFADGSASVEEQAVLDRLKNELRIEDALAYKVAEVVILKNKV